MIDDGDDMFPPACAEDWERYNSDLDAVPMKHWAKRLVEYIEVVEAGYLRIGLDDETAFKYARFAVLEIAKYNGKSVTYFPEGESLMTALRDAEIYRKFTGANYQALADEYDIGVQQAYRIMAEQRKLHKRKLQPELPLDGG